MSGGAVTLTSTYKESLGSPGSVLSATSTQVPNVPAATPSYRIVSPLIRKEASLGVKTLGSSLATYCSSGSSNCSPSSISCCGGLLNTSTPIFPCILPRSCVPETETPICFGVVLSFVKVKLPEVVVGFLTPKENPPCAFVVVGLSREPFVNPTAAPAIGFPAKST